MRTSTISQQTLVRQYGKRRHTASLKKHLNYHLLTLYAQLGGITLAPPVLPRRLARVFAGAHDKERCIITTYPTFTAVHSSVVQHRWVER
jgi:hypothetical protein